jgi:hypothetical protein
VAKWIGVFHVSCLLHFIGSSLTWVSIHTSALLREDQEFPTSAFFPVNTHEYSTKSLYPNHHGGNEENMEPYMAQSSRKRERSGHVVPTNTPAQQKLMSSTTFFDCLHDANPLEAFFSSSLQCLSTHEAVKISRSNKVPRFINCPP